MSNTLSTEQRAPAPGWSEWFARVLHLDLWLLSLLFALSALGLLVLYSASGHSMDVVANQMQRLGLGMLVLFACAQLPPDLYRLAAPWLYGITLVLLILVLTLGDDAKGAVRWLDVGLFRFQPSELMKLAMPLAIAAYLHRRPLPPRPQDLVAVLMMIVVPVLLVVKQPDLGTALLIVAGGGFALFFSGLGWRWILATMASVAAAAPVLWHFLHDYQRKRVLTFLDPELDPLGAGYHITQSKIAIGSGGLFGKGLLNGTQAKLDFLPEAHTDFIFAVYAEELGLLGVLLLLTLYITLVSRGLIIALRGQDTFQRLLAGSLSLMLFLYVFINIGMVIGLLPVVGVPLPLMSYGGTSMVSLLAGFGMLTSIQTHRKLVSS
ncbi:MAG: rod shape-determining protein RodA [Pseudomonadota bacterium]